MGVTPSTSFVGDWFALYMLINCSVMLAGTLNVGSSPSTGSIDEGISCLVFETSPFEKPLVSYFFSYIIKRSLTFAEAPLGVCKSSGRSVLLLLGEVAFC